MKTEKSFNDNWLARINEISVRELSSFDIAEMVLPLERGVSVFDDCSGKKMPFTWLQNQEAYDVHAEMKNGTSTSYDWETQMETLH